MNPQQHVRGRVQKRAMFHQICYFIDFFILNCNALHLHCTGHTMISFKYLLTFTPLHDSNPYVLLLLPHIHTIYTTPRTKALVGDLVLCNAFFCLFF